jgi:hypothetical protein
MIMTQQEFIQSVPRYDFRIFIVDSKTKQEREIGNRTDDLDEIIYESGEMAEILEGRPD